MAGS
jgi:dynein heavy chain